MSTTSIGIICLYHSTKILCNQYHSILQYLVSSIIRLILKGSFKLIISFRKAASQNRRKSLARFLQDSLKGGLVEQLSQPPRLYI